LGLVTPLDDMTKYYPDNYFSFAPPQLGWIGALIRRIGAQFAVDGPPVLFAGWEWYESGQFKALRDAKATRSMRILDLGCGSGNFISDLRDIGFRGDR
jgi:2-polyprenyl-3-methyl-5-hydroxy-6-metoxy-1,4-benzoquinol methylase